MCPNKIMPLSQSVAAEPDGLIIVAANKPCIRGHAAITRSKGITGAEAQCVTRLSVTLLPKPAKGQRSPIVSSCQGKIWVQPEREVVLRYRIVKTAIEQIDTAQRIVSPGIFAIRTDCGECGSLGYRHSRGHLLPTHMSAKGVASRKNAQSLAIVRIDADCFLQKS